MLINRGLYFTWVALFTLMCVWGASLAQAAPSAYVTYADEQTNTVDIIVHFDDEGGNYTKVQYASAMSESGANLQWSGYLPITGTNPDRQVVIDNATKYMNYYVRIADSADNNAVYVRAFPVSTGSGRLDNVYTHGNNGQGCAGCHVTHASLKASLLAEASYYETCMLCHSNANSQSKYDVESGLVSVAGGTQPSLAGPFVNQKGIPTVSGHNADDSLGLLPVNVPGSDQSGSHQLSLTCISCHIPHGTIDDNYRLLRNTIYADDNRELVSNNVYYRAYAITADAFSGEDLYMVEGNTEFCAACHSDYKQGNAQSSGGIYASDVPAPGPGLGRYRHPVSVGGGTIYSVYGADGLREPPFEPTAGDVLPLQYNPGEAKVGLTDKRTAVVCSTCHYAHGSTKEFNVDDTSIEGRYILRLPNYGVCESCHKK